MGKFFIAGLLAVFPLSVPPVFGAQWSVEPMFRSEGQFYDNLRLTPLPHRNVWAIKASASVALSYKTEVLTVRANPRYEYVGYWSDDPIDNTFNNVFFPFSGSYRTELDRLRVNASINRDNALISELEETGLVTSFIPRNFRNIRGSWDRSVTEQVTMQSSYQLTDVNYERTGDINLFDYQSHTGTVGAEYERTEKTRFHTTALYTNYHVPKNAFRAQAPGLEIGLSHRISETVVLAGSGGLRYVRTTFQENGQRQHATNLTWLLDISLDKEWERSHLKVGYRRMLNPSGLGILFITDRVDLAVDHQLTYALKVSFQGTFTDNDTVGSSANLSQGSRSRYFQISPAVAWRVTDSLSCDLSYRHAQRQVKRSDRRTAHSNAVFIGLTYTWSKWSVSR